MHRLHVLHGVWTFLVFTTVFFYIAKSSNEYANLRIFTHIVNDEEGKYQDFEKILQECLMDYPEPRMKEADAIWQRENQFKFIYHINMIYLPSNTVKKSSNDMRHSSDNIAGENNDSEGGIRNSPSGQRAGGAGSLAKAVVVTLGFLLLNTAGLVLFDNLLQWFDVICADFNKFAADDMQFGREDDQNVSYHVQGQTPHEVQEHLTCKISGDRYPDHYSPDFYLPNPLLEICEHENLNGADNVTLEFDNLLQWFDVICADLNKFAADEVQFGGDADHNVSYHVQDQTPHVIQEHLTCKISGDRYPDINPDHHSPDFYMPHHLLQICEHVNLHGADNVIREFDEKGDTQRKFFRQATEHEE